MKDNTSKNTIPKPIKNQVMVREHYNEDEENQLGRRRDLDRRSSTQNFRNVARQGDLSPRYMEKTKSAGRGRKKKEKESSAVQTVGVQTRMTISKSTN